MFHQLDAIITNLLKSRLAAYLATDKLTFSFSAPDPDFATAVTPPAVNLFLYDMRENWELRSNEWREERVNGRYQRTPPPARVDCSYLITAWTAESGERGTAAEHELLGDVMRALLRHRRIPADYLPEAWQQEPPLRANVLQQGNLNSLGEFWQAMGGKPKAALHYTVTISVPVVEEATELAPPPREHKVRIHQVSPPAQRAVQIAPAAQNEEEE
jgi:hypothetical protein